MMHKSEEMLEKNAAIDLILNVRKPLGWTSFDVIRLIKPYLPKVKIGHAGTLDPFAEGVLLVCLGQATKKVPQLVGYDKEYWSQFRFGMATDTLDVTGQIIQRDASVEISSERVQQVCRLFIGEIQQVPPAFSAVKVNGQRSYQLARKGDEVQIESRRIRIDSIELEKADGSIIELTIVCSKGTYIRSLARDIAQTLGTVGYVNSLVRRRIGPYKLDASIEVNEIVGYLKKTILKGIS
jgi:tRNA pseudouridine55 synthase